jgi:hypothetical protein
MMYLSERQLRPQFNKTMSEALTEISRRSKAAAHKKAREAFMRKSNL